MTAEHVCHLADLRGHRSAPELTAQQRRLLQEELRLKVGACEWCTIGVMAPGGAAAWAALRSFEQALGWAPLASIEGEVTGLSVFLKGHQRTGQVWLREEGGLGEGVLVTGHSASNPEAEDTWGPLPLDFFAADSSCGSEGGAATL